MNKLNVFFKLNTTQEYVVEGKHVSMLWNTNKFSFLVTAQLHIVALLASELKLIHHVIMMTITRSHLPLLPGPPVCDCGRLYTVI